MGSATRDAMAAARRSLDALGLSATPDAALKLGEELFLASRVIGSSKQLQQLLGSQSAPLEDKRTVLERIFGGSLAGNTEQLLGSLLSGRWSSTDDLIAGIEELGLRAIADSAQDSADGASIDAELADFAATIASDAQLELAIGSRMAESAAKVALVDRLLTGKVSAQTHIIVRQLVQQPRGRRIGRLLAYAASVVADQAGMSIMSITTASPLDDAQRTKLQAQFSQRYGKSLRVNEIIDPSIIGGVRVQVGDDVIDGTVVSRLRELESQLAG